MENVLAGDEAAREWRICHDGYTSFIDNVNEARLFNLQLKGAEFHLYYDDLLPDTLHSLRSLQRRCAALTQTKPSNPSALDIRAQSLQHDLNRHIRVDAMLVVQVNIVGLQSREGVLELPFDVGRFAVR